MDSDTERTLHRILDIQEKQVEMCLTLGQAIMSVAKLVLEEPTDAQKKHLLKGMAMLERQLQELREALVKQ